MSQLSYLDFEIEIDERAGELFPVAVLRSPGGETRARMDFPFTGQTLRDQLAAVADAVLRVGDASSQATVRDFGARLFDSLFLSEIRSLYDVSRRVAADRGQGLRIKLRILSPELAVVPWEFLFDSRTDEFVTLSRQTPVVRYLELAHGVQRLAVAPPLHILGLVSAPSDLPPVDVTRERTRIEQALAPLQNAGQVQLVWLDGATPAALQTALQQGPWHIFHYVGHAAFEARLGEGVLALEDDDGRASFLTATQLARLLADHADIRLALLNACDGARGDEQRLFASTATHLVRRGLPAVVAMQYPISDRAAIEFSRGFYGALAANFAIDAATAEARKAIDLAQRDSIEWGAPVLYMRAPDGAIWEVDVDEKNQDEPSQPEKKEPGLVENLFSNINFGGDTGDVIFTQVEGNISGSGNVVGSKDVTVYASSGEPEADDKKVIEQQFAALNASLNAMSGQLDADKVQMAQFQLPLLQAELTKVDEDEQPSASVIVQVGSWLLDNLPELAEAVASLFTTPAVVKVIGKAGDSATQWMAQRFKS